MTLNRGDSASIPVREASFLFDRWFSQQVPVDAGYEFSLKAISESPRPPTKTSSFAAKGHHAVVSSPRGVAEQFGTSMAPCFHQPWIVCRYPQQGYNPGYPNASGSQAFPAQGTSYSQQQQLPPQGYPQNATQGMQQPTYGAHPFPAQQQYGAQAGMHPQGQQQPQFGAQQQYPGAQAGGMPGSFPQGQQGFQQGFPQGQQGFQQGFPQGQQGFQQSYPGKTFTTQV